MATFVDVRRVADRFLRDRVRVEGELRQWHDLDDGLGSVKPLEWRLAEFLAIAWPAVKDLSVVGRQSNTLIPPSASTMASPASDPSSAPVSRKLSASSTVSNSWASSE